MSDIDGTILKIVLLTVAVVAVSWVLLIAITWSWWALPWLVALVVGAGLGAAVAKSTGSVILSLLPVALLLGGAGIVSTRWFPWALDHGPDELLAWLLGLLGIRLPANPSAECPRCRSKSFKQVASRSDSYDTTMTETRRKTHYNVNGEETGYSEEEYEVPAVHTRTYTDLKCSSCGHAWTV